VLSEEGGVEEEVVVKQHLAKLYDRVLSEEGGEEEKRLTVGDASNMEAALLEAAIEQGTGEVGQSGYEQSGYEHGKPGEGLECMASLADITDEDGNYCEYQSAPSMVWHPAKYSREVVEKLLETQFVTWIEAVQKADCEAELKRRLGKGPPEWIEDIHALPIPEEDTHICRVWFASDGTERSAILKGAVSGKERTKLWGELKMAIGSKAEHAEALAARKKEEDGTEIGYPAPGDTGAMLLEEVLEQETGEGRYPVSAVLDDEEAEKEQAGDGDGEEEYDDDGDHDLGDVQVAKPQVEQRTLCARGDGTPIGLIASAPGEALEDIGNGEGDSAVTGAADDSGEDDDLDEVLELMQMQAEAAERLAKL
jgi:hypothetical protein